MRPAAAKPLRVCQHRRCNNSITIQNQSGFCALHSRSVGGYGRRMAENVAKAFRNRREKALREKLDALDVDALACFERNRKVGASVSQSLSLARDDMAIRAKLAANANEGFGTFEHVGTAARRAISNAGRASQ